MGNVHPGSRQDAHLLRAQLALQVQSVELQGQALPSCAPCALGILWAIREPGGWGQQRATLLHGKEAETGLVLWK